MTEVTAPTKDERLTAALAHASILFGIFTSGFGGIITALVIWLVQKDKSRYVAFHALQSVVYQTASMLLMILSWCCWSVLYMALIFVPLTTNPEAYEVAPPAGMWVGLALTLVPLAVGAIFLLYGLWAAIRTLDGRDFEYLIIGRWLRKQ
ncbi:MAG: DUF4870 domain-containing protein [Anaerolineae bacterium]|nr:DUF4870 domain-containing protein [Anaerolineae bacterium]